MSYVCLFSCKFGRYNRQKLKNGLQTFLSQKDLMSAYNLTNLQLNYFQFYFNSNHTLQYLQVSKLILFLVEKSIATVSWLKLS